MDHKLLEEYYEKFDDSPGLKMLPPMDEETIEKMLRRAIDEGKPLWTYFYGTDPAEDTDKLY